MLRRVVTSGMGVFALAALVFGVIAFARPPAQSADARFYLKLSDGIRDGRWDVILTTEKATWTVVTLPVILVAARSVAPVHWPYVVVAINVLAMAAAAALLAAIVRWVTQSLSAVAVALAFLFAAYDVAVWLRFILTDMIYTGLALAAFALVIRGIVMDEQPGRRRVLLGLSLAASFVTRASGAILIPLAIFAEYWVHERGKADRFVRRAMPWVFLALGVLGMLMRAYVYDDMNRWPTDFLRPILEQYAAREKTGEVVWDRHETAHLPPKSVAGHLLIELDRFVRFFQFTSSGYSRAHNLIATAYYVPLYLLGMIGVVHGLLKAERRRRLIVQVTVLWILASAWLHAVTILDFDWRYRLPLVPHLILLAACGVDVLMRRGRDQAAESTFTVRSTT